MAFDPNTIRSVISKIYLRSGELRSRGMTLSREGRPLMAELNFAAADEIAVLAQDLEKIAERIEGTGE